MNISFDEPLILVLGMLSLALVFFVSRRLKSVLSLELSLGPPGGTAFSAPVNLGFLTKTLRALEYAAFLLLFAAAAGPYRGITETVYLSRGADILFVLDVSPSMAALDMNGQSRFDAARTLIRDFAARRPQDAVGLVALGDTAALLVPLTLDREALYDRLDTLELGELGDGTALGLGLAIAARCMSGGGSGPARRAVVLITDGENNAGSVNPETAAALLPQTGSSFWVIGVGSGGEVPFNYVDPKTRMRREGIFNSRYDPESLIKLAEKGRGRWIPAASAGAFAGAFEKLDREEMTVVRSSQVRRQEPFHNAFLLGGIVLLCLCRFVRRILLGALL